MKPDTAPVTPTHVPTVLSDLGDVPWTSWLKKAVVGIRPDDLARKQILAGPNGNADSFFLFKGSDIVMLAGAEDVEDKGCIHK
jgi:hypothetical protein